MTLTPLSERYPNHPFTREALAARAQKIRSEIVPRAEKVVRSGIGSATSATVAEQVYRSMAARGPLPAIVTAVASASLARGVVEASVQAGLNVYHDRPWHTDLPHVALDGMRKGAISGSLYLSIKPLRAIVARRMPHLSENRVIATASGVRGAIGGLVGASSDPDTWRNGTAGGVGRVVAKTAWGATRGYVVGGAGQHMNDWWRQKFERWVDVAPIEGLSDWQDAVIDAFFDK